MKDNKFDIGDRIFVLQSGDKRAMTSEFTVNGIVLKKDEGAFYTDNYKEWVPEKRLFSSRDAAYRSMMGPAEMEYLAYLR